MFSFNENALCKELINLCDARNYAQGRSDKSFHKYYQATDPLKIAEYENKYDDDFAYFDLCSSKLETAKQLLKNAFGINVLLKEDCYGYITHLTIEIFNDEFTVISYPLYIPGWITRHLQSEQAKTIEKYFDHEIHFHDNITDEITNGEIRNESK